jgi:hypothetical protein
MFPPSTFVVSTSTLTESTTTSTESTGSTASESTVVSVDEPPQETRAKMERIAKIFFIIIFFGLFSDYKYNKLMTKHQVGQRIIKLIIKNYRIIKFSIPSVEVNSSCSEI